MTSIPLTTDGQLSKVIIRASDKLPLQRPPRQCRVRCHYVASLANGTVFDSSLARNEVYEFELGANRVIKGWEIGIQSMAVGEKSRFTIGPNYAYGDEAPPDSPIPKGATLTFEVDLLGFDLRRDASEHHDKSILLQTLNPDDFPPVDPAAAHDDPSKAVRKAIADDTVHISYELRSAAGAVLEPQRTVTFQLGEQGVPPAVETALFHMRANERAIVDVVRGVAASALRPPKSNEYRFFDAIPADWLDAERAVAAERARLDAEEKHVHRRPHWVRPYDDNDVAARMHITLHSIAPESFGWDLSTQQQVEAAAAAKSRGAALFAQERFEQAKRKFKRAVTLTEQALRVTAGDDPLEAQATEIALSCHLNIAACLLKQKEYTNVLEATNHALKIDPNNVKALFRRAQALVQLHRWDEADELLLTAAHLEPSNKAVRDEIQQMKTRRQEHAAKERTIFTSMFDKLADQEANERKARLERAAHERVLLEQQRKAAEAAAATPSATPSE